jgi:hypothetical protein
MLERLENSFDAQKYFVSNISHEPTPLAAIMRTGISLRKRTDKEEYQQTINLALKTPAI